MADMSISGIASGIDWDSMVTKMLENAKKPAYVILDKRDKLELKKGLWEELRVSMQALQSSLSPLKLASTFKAKQVEIERIDRNTSYKGVLTATVNADAEINAYDLEVLKLAQGQVNRSKSFSSATSQFGSIFGSSSSYFYVNAGGHKVRIDVASTDTLNSLAEKINTKLKAQIPPVGVTATVLTDGSDNKLVLKSDDVGLGRMTHQATITRSPNSYDTVSFSMNPDNTDPNLEPPTYTLDMELGGINGGSITIAGEDGKIYTLGVDFDVVNGNRIRWRDSPPLVPPPGAVYTDLYTAHKGDTFSVTTTRSSDGNVDTNVLPFIPKSGAGITIESSGGTTYSSVTDFQVAPDGSVHWLGIIKPTDGDSYKVTYIADGGENVTLEITRDNQDTLLGTSYAEFVGETTTIRSAQPGSKVWREGFDFDIVQNAAGEAVVQWYTGGAGDAPEPGDFYTVTNGTKSYPGTVVRRSTQDIVRLPNNGTFESVPHGTHTIKYNGQEFTYNPPSPPPDSDYLLLPGVWSYDALLDSNKENLEIKWLAPDPPPDPSTLGTSPKSPTYGNKYTVTYNYNSSTFALSDDGNGTLAALGLDNMDEAHYTAAQDAELILDGEKITRSSNHIGEGYLNELIKGMTIELKGVGRVSLDVSQDAEAAVTAMQSFLTAYNDILSWINTRMTEKEVDAATKATLDADDFRMRWGYLKGNSLLRSTKDTMRRLTSQAYATAFSKRTSRNAIYGAMSQNGIVNPGSFSIAAGARIATIPVRPGDTLQDIADRINSPQIDGIDNPLYVSADKNPILYAKASVTDDKLVITEGPDGQQLILGGSAYVLASLGLNYEYNTLSQIGLKLPSTGEMTTQGNSGELTFDTSAFMAALEKNPDDVSMLVTNFAGQTQTFVDNMIKASTKEVAAGVTTAQGAVAREINAIDEEIKSIDKYLTDFERRLQTKQESLYKQFSAAEVNLSKMMQQASWLANVTAQLQQQSAS